MSPVDGALIGRAAERRSLLDALRAAQNERPATLIVSGEAGIGKTALVQDLLVQALADGCLVSAAACSPVTAVELPFGPVADLMADVLTQVDGPSLVPEPLWQALSPITGEHPPGPATDQDGTRLFLGFAAFLSAASRVRPLVLLVEDVHWADPASVDLLMHLTRRHRADRILLVVTHRPVTASAEGWLRTALTEWFRQPRTVDVHLTGLDDGDIAKIISGLAPGSVGERLGMLCELAQGIPFFAVQLASHRVDLPLPRRLHDVLALSLAGLTGQQRSLLLLLAVSGGSDVADELLLTASGLSAPEFAAHARDLRDRGSLVVRDGTVGFRHALLRDVVLSDALPVEVRQTHELISDALCRNDSDQIPGLAGRLAHHLHECGREAEALRYAVRAAREAADIRAFGDAFEHYRTAIALWDSVADPETPAGSTLVQLVCAAALAARWRGRASDGLTLLDELTPRVPPTDSDRALWEHTRGQLRWALGDLAGALESQQRADALLAPLPGDALPAGPRQDDAHQDDPLRAAVLAAVAHGLMVTGHAADAERTAMVAADLAGAGGAERERLQAAITAGAARAQLGRVDEAVAGLRRCVVQARERDDLELVVRAYGNLAFALGSAGREQELLEVTGEGIAECRKYGPVASLASTLINNHVNALIAVGRWDEARSLASEVLQDGVSDGLVLHLQLRLAELAVAQGRWEEVDRHLAEAGERAGSDPYALSALTMLTAERALWRDEPATAARLIADTMPALRELDDPGLLLGACVLGLRAAAEIADLQPRTRREQPSPAATDLLATAHRAHGIAAVPTATALLRLCEAEVARLTGTDTSAIWTSVADANRSIGHPAAVAYCLLHNGIVLLRRQARVAASRALTEAAAIAQQLRAAPLLSRVQTIISLGALEPAGDEGPRPSPTRSGTPESRLTAREKQVLALLTTGATNRMIGRTLFISERTASVHVSNILTKMGAANRTDAARMALRARVDTESG